tara:strand:+ start:191 stop:1276 length:1086 start_codon:yes stop_codon:yes gene_type:complete
MNNIIWFRTDKLGDFLIHSHLIRDTSISIKNSHTTVVCSPYNEKIIKEYEFINETIPYHKDFSLYKKIKILLRILKRNYHTSVAIDGKKFSYFCSLLAKSKNKIGLVYKVKSKLFGLFKYTRYRPFTFRFISEYVIFDHIKVMTGRGSLQYVEHLPSIYISLLEVIQKKTKNTDSYVFPVNKQSDVNILKLLNKIKYKEFFLIHLDEKWVDIHNFDTECHKLIEVIQQSINMKIVITSFNNTLSYMKNIRSNFDTFDQNIGNTSILENFNKNIIHLENIPIFEFERLIFNSKHVLSCHSGFVVQVCGANSSHVIDLLNSYDCMWYDCWVPYNTKYSRVLKSDDKRKYSHTEITDQIKKILV